MSDLAPPPGAPPTDDAEAQRKWVQELAASCRAQSGAEFARMAAALDETLAEAERAPERSIAPDLQALSLFMVVQQLAALHDALLRALPQATDEAERQAVEQKRLEVAGVAGAVADAYEALREQDVSALARLRDQLATLG